MGEQNRYNGEWEDRPARGYEPRNRAPAVPDQFRAVQGERDTVRRDYQPVRQAYSRPVASWQPQPQGPGYAPVQQHYAPQPGMFRKTSLTAAEQFWYVLMCIGMGAGYFAKIPAKKALSDFGLAEMTAAEKFWYVLMCLPMGAAYFCKVPVAKAITEMQGR